MMAMHLMEMAVAQHAKSKIYGFAFNQLEYLSAIHVQMHLC